MKRTPVDSSSVASVGYNRRGQVLEVEFRNGAVYDYLDVPSPVYLGLLAAASKGRFVNYRIKPRYRYRRVYL